MRYDLTIDDPGAYTAPFSGTSNLRWESGTELFEYVCQQGNQAFTLMVGDNIYEGPAGPEDYRLKFEEPYRGLLDEGVQFFAALGNHDDPQEIHYEHFNMRGRRYYRFAPPGNLQPMPTMAMGSERVNRAASTCGLNSRNSASARRNSAS